jgi:alkyl sulfatase-like protein
MTHSPAAAAAAACALEASTAAALSQFEDPGAARSQLGDTGAALSLCAAGATAIAVTAIAATVSVRRQWARLRSVRLRRGPTIAAAAAMTPTATMFAPAGTSTERRDADRHERWGSHPAPATKLPTPNTASPDTVRAMSADLFFDYLGVRLIAEKAGDARAKLNFDFGKDGNYFVELENGVLNHTANMKSNNADATLTLSRDTLNSILQQTKLDDAISSGAVKISGDQTKLRDVVSSLDTFEFWFNIVTP